MTTAPQPLPADPRWLEVELFGPDELARLREDERLEMARQVGRAHARQSAVQQGKPEKVEIVEVELPWADI